MVYLSYLMIRFGTRVFINLCIGVYIIYLVQVNFDLEPCRVDGVAERPVPEVAGAPERVDLQAQLLQPVLGGARQCAHRAGALLQGDGLLGDALRRCNQRPPPCHFFSARTHKKRQIPRE
jgi:hypothetical protein